ncbi:MAG TPA: DUF952 domain-containing protein [Acidimicrobiales bacterium]|nr:DUF952 domain-containing protein [Acidimicrobiales bacterium]
MPENIFHVTRASDWEAAVASGEYRRSTVDRTLEEEGFIHCSTAAQVPGTLARFYRGLDGLVQLTIDPDRLGGIELRWEGDTEAFPTCTGHCPSRRWSPWTRSTRRRPDGRSVARGRQSKGSDGSSGWPPLASSTNRCRRPPAKAGSCQRTR